MVFFFHRSRLGHKSMEKNSVRNLHMFTAQTENSANKGYVCMDGHFYLAKVGCLDFMCLPASRAPFCSFLSSLER